MDRRSHDRLGWEIVASARRFAAERVCSTGHA